MGERGGWRSGGWEEFGYVMYICICIYVYVCAYIYIYRVTPGSAPPLSSDLRPMHILQCNRPESRIRKQTSPSPPLRHLHTCIYSAKVTGATP